MPMDAGGDNTYMVTLEAMAGSEMDMQDRDHHGHRRE